MNSEEIRGRFKESPKLKRFVDWLIMNQVQSEAEKVCRLADYESGSDTSEMVYPDAGTSVSAPREMLCDSSFSKDGHSAIQKVLAWQL